MNYESALAEIVLSDERYLVMTAENRAAIRSLPARLGPRFLDAGIAEQALVGAAAGLALRGRVPVVHALAAFLTMRAFEFIRTDVGLGRLPVKLIGGVPGFLSEANGPTHQALEDVALMRGIPGMRVFCPADEQDLVLGLPHILASPYPCYVRHCALQPIVEHEREFQIGKAELVPEGAPYAADAPPGHHSLALSPAGTSSEIAEHQLGPEEDQGTQNTDVALLVYGMLFRQAVEARNLLSSQGIAVRLLNLRTLQPIDVEAILAAVRQARLVVTIEDHFLAGGLFSIVSELLVRGRHLDEPYVGPSQVFPLALENRWFKPALLDELLKYEGFTGPQIAERALRELDQPPALQRRRRGRPDQIVAATSPKVPSQGRRTS